MHRYPRLIAHADDILIFHDRNENPQGIMSEIGTLSPSAAWSSPTTGARARRGGRAPWCTVSRDKETVASVPEGGPRSCRHQEAPISSHEEQCPWSRTPLVETSPQGGLEAFDTMVGEAMESHRNIGRHAAVFIAAPKTKGGLGIHLPGVYHAQVRVLRLSRRGEGHEEAGGCPGRPRGQHGSCGNRAIGSLRLLQTSPRHVQHDDPTRSCPGRAQTRGRPSSARRVAACSLLPTTRSTAPATL